MRTDEMRKLEQGRAEGAKQECEAIAAMGAVVAGARAEMDRAGFRAWLGEVRLDADAAKRYERVASKREALARFFGLGALAGPLRGRPSRCRRCQRRRCAGSRTTPR